MSYNEWAAIRFIKCSCNEADAPLPPLFKPMAACGHDHFGASEAMAFAKAPASLAD